LIEPVKQTLFRKIIPRPYYSKSDVTPFFRANGYPPDTQEYKGLLDSGFAGWKLKVHGLVKTPLELSLVDLRAMKIEIQITEHSCIQGWTAIGEWGGVPMNYIMSLCKPTPEARFVVFYSYQWMDLNSMKQ
jgi:DMSO/TMAO reductase YedYZ molybdopterin-dependent catalytic subunit